jgi:acyl-coenzyme A synthetase/AMP-(fatty) acid ligase
VLVSTGAEQQLEGVLRHHVRQVLGGSKTPRAFYFVNRLPETVRPGLRRSKAETVTMVRVPNDAEDVAREEGPL